MPLFKGPQKIKVTHRPGYVLDLFIQADGSFTAYTLDKGNRDTIIGPFKTESRQVRARIHPDVKYIDLATAKSTFIQIDERYIPDGKEYPDPTPIEVPIGYNRPETLQETMRRFIRDELSTQYTRSGHESFDEAYDFDIEDDDPDPLSQYEIMDMVDEYPPDDSPDSTDTQAESESDINPSAESPGLNLLPEGDIPSDGGAPATQPDTTPPK